MASSSKPVWKGKRQILSRAFCQSVPLIRRQGRISRQRKVELKHSGQNPALLTFVATAQTLIWPRRFQVAFHLRPTRFHLHRRTDALARKSSMKVELINEGVGIALNDGVTGPAR